MTDITQWTSVQPYITDMPLWMPEDDQERIAAYVTYENIYWSNPNSFRLEFRGDNQNPIYVPNAKTIVDTTSHYLLKGLELKLDGVEEDDPAQKEFERLLKREKFYATFAVSKHAGVVRGDHIIHVTADPTKPAGRRISVTNVDPARYFPIFDEDDVDKLLGCHLVDTIWYPKEQVHRIRQLTYRYRVVNGVRRVTIEDQVLELDRWADPRHKRIYKTLQKEALLAPSIQTIPVYAFKNVDWQGQPFGSSELRGYERLMAGINQTISDEDIALALEGLGVFATDSGRPVDQNGDEEDWIIAPAKVMEVPGGSYFRRVEGVGSVTPMLDHVKYLEHTLMTSSATFDANAIEVAVAESGVALAIRFMPTLAKLEERDLEGVGVLEQMWFDIRTGWWPAYEGKLLSDKEIDVTLGKKLPLSGKERLNELNNMFDRKIITPAYYRQEMEKLGYRFPKDMDEQVIAHIKKMQEVVVTPQSGRPDPDDTVPDESQARNKDRPNESGGTEA